MLSGNKQPTLQHISRRYLVFNKPRELNMKQLQEIDDEFEKIPHEDRTKLTFLKHIGKPYLLITILLSTIKVYIGYDTNWCHSKIYYR